LFSIIKIICNNFIAAIDYLLTNPTEPVDRKALEENAGIGVIVTPEEIERVICDVIEQNKTKLLEQRHDFSIGTLLSEVRKRLKWADGKAVKTEMDAQVKFFI
jgi:glutaminyl-tRNA synthetase